MSVHAAAAFWLGEVQGVTVDVQYYVAGGVANGHVRVRGGIIEQSQGFFICFVGALVFRYWVYASGEALSPR